MLLVERIHTGPGTANATLTLPFDLRCKSRLRTRLASGEEIGLFLPAGTVLRGGMLLAANDGRIVAVAAADEPLIEVRAGDTLLLARAAYHLGNRHVAVQLSADWLRLQPDHVLEQMLLGLGTSVQPIQAPFEPEAGAYAGGGHSEAGVHDHGHDHDQDHGHDHDHAHHGHDHSHKH